MDMDMDFLTNKIEIASSSRGRKMSGFFSSLGGKEQDPQTEINININNDNHTNSNNNSFLLFKNHEIYNKGFELWQQYYQLHQQQRHDHDHEVDFSIGPSRRNDVVSSSGEENYRSAAGLRVMRQGRGGGADGINCQDCGNQAKKDCLHLRCRTCCKSRGFDCATHVKSTWVPAAKRRERLHQQQLAVTGENPKRIREDHGSGGGGAGLACTGAAGFELGNFPAEVNSPAVFRCVRVSAVDDAAEHYAYQTAVNISGHVFKGILYDQGRYGGGESSSGSHHQQQQQPLDLIAAAAATTSSAAAATSHAHMTMLESSAYPTPLNAFMAGTQFFPPPRP